MTAVLAPSQPDAGRRSRLVVLAVCCASMVVAVMDVSIVNVALPAIGRDLGASTAQLQWIVDSYALVLATFMVLSGSLADRFGRRRIFVIGLTVFGLGSMMCALAPGISWLIAARAFQAVGGAMLNPVAMAIVANTFVKPAERARAVGVFGSMSGLALALGPILGGVLVDSVGWRAVFLVNVPVVVIAIIAALRLVPESRAARARRFDPVGQILLGTLLAGIVYAVIEARTLGWTSPTILSLGLVAVLSLLGIAVYEPRRREPLLELGLFRSVPLSAAIVMALIALCAFQAFLFVTTLYLQDVRGLSPLKAGLSLIPVGLLGLVLSPVSGRLVAARGPRGPVLLAGTSLATGGAALLRLSSHTALPAVLAMSMCFGTFLGLINPPITNTAVSGMPRSMAGVASGLASAGRQTGITLGVAIAGAIVAPALARGVDYTRSARTVWWIEIGLGISLAALALISTTPAASVSARRAAARFEEIERTRR